MALWQEQPAHRSVVGNVPEVRPERKSVNVGFDRAQLGADAVHEVAIGVRIPLVETERVVTGLALSVVQPTTVQATTARPATARARPIQWPRPLSSSSLRSTRSGSPAEPATA